MGNKNSRRKRDIIDDLSVINQSLGCLKEQKETYDKMLVKRKTILDSMLIQKKQLEKQITILRNETSKYSSFECKICFDRVIDVMCLPCCHTYCQECSKNMKDCFMCNTNVMEKVKIFH
tara:strand:+ start:482 stop:838 length:357 start_codon:yes stop_codon:yes gene_type:complete